MSSTNPTEFIVARPRSRLQALSWWFERNIAYVLILPTILGIVLITLYPLIYAFVISFQDKRLRSKESPFIWFDNYRAIISDSEIWHSIWTTLLFAGLSVAGSFIIGLILALLLNRPLRGRRYIRSLFIIPWAIPAFVAALTWSWMFNDQFGIITAQLKGWGVDNPPIWLDKSHALWSLIGVMTWKSFPFQLVILLAGLQTISPELYEAAAVDGANPLQRFRAITLPLLRPVAMVSILLAAINAFHYFPIPWIMTRGGPSNATNVISIETYNQAFQTGNFGRGSAAAFLMFAFILAISSLYIWAYIREVRNR